MENIIKIKNENYLAKINLSRGANCISLKNIKYNVIICTWRMKKKWIKKQLKILKYQEKKF